MADLCTIQDIEIYLGITLTDDPSTSNDDYDKYSYIISAVSKEMETIMYRTILAADYTEVLDANGTNSLFLNNYPVQSITTVKYGSPFAGNTRDEITDYISYSDTAEITFASEFPEAPQMFEVVYNAGFSTVPLDLNLACVEEVVRAFNASIKDGNIKKEKLGDYSYELTTSSETKSNFREKLNKYIRNDL